MRKCCQLINVDVDVDANESSRQLVEDGITTRRWLVDSPGGGYCHIWAIWVCAAVKGMVFKQFTLG